MSTHRITLTDRQLEDVRRAMLAAAAEDMERVAQDLRELSTRPWPWNTLSIDTQGGVRFVRDSLSILDALGWPDDETRAEWETRMAKVATAEDASV